MYGDKNFQFKLYLGTDVKIFCSGLNLISAHADPKTKINPTLGWGPHNRWELFDGATDFIFSTFAPGLHQMTPGRGERGYLTLVRSDGSERKFTDVIVKKSLLLRVRANGTVLEFVVPPAAGTQRLSEKIAGFQTTAKQSENRLNRPVIMDESMVMPGVVHRDFDSENHGEFLRAYATRDAEMTTKLYQSMQTPVKPARMTHKLMAAINEGTISLTNAYALAKLPLAEQDAYLLEAFIASPMEFGPRMEKLRKELRSKPKVTQARLVAGRFIEDGDYEVTVR